MNPLERQLMIAREANALDRRAAGLRGLGQPGDPPTAGMYVWSVVATASMAASAYHGYKRNNSVGWAVVWGAMGAIFPVITPVIAVAEGYAKPARKK